MIKKILYSESSNRLNLLSFLFSCFRSTTGTPFLPFQPDCFHLSIAGALPTNLLVVFFVGIEQLAPTDTRE